MTASLYNRLDGGGRLLKEPIADVVGSHVRARGHRFDHAFEWCAGLGEMGFELLKRDLVERLTLADINPQAMAVSHCIGEAMGHGDNVLHFVSDNLDRVPRDLRFDLVIGNPPNYCNLQPGHPAGAMMARDLRPNDRGWCVHERFFQTIGDHLASNAVLLIQEVEPFARDVFISGHCYDRRPEPPIDTFDRMTRADGLHIEECTPLIEVGDVTSYLLTIRRQTKRKNGDF